MSRLLVVEDDESIAKPLARALGREGFDVVHVGTGGAALDLLDAEAFDVIILDLTLPDLDGLDVCQRLRVDHPAIPVVMLTARASEVDILVGFDAGADDYVTKPFRMAELVARVRARLRATTAAPPVTEVGEVRLDAAARRAWSAAGELRLTPTEFDLLQTLLASPGRAVSRDELSRAVWGSDVGPSRTLDMHMSSLRRKLGPDRSGDARIATVRGVGYRLEAVPGGS